MSFGRPAGTKDGEDVERSVLSVSRAGKSKQEAMYMSYKDAVSHAKKNQPSEFKPETQKFANGIYEALKHQGLPEGVPVKFYTAVGTPLDIYHGTDALFEIAGQDITIDVTINPEKVEAKADVVVQLAFNDEGGIDYGEGGFEYVAKEIMIKLTSKLTKSVKNNKPKLH